MDSFMQKKPEVTPTTVCSTSKEDCNYCNWILNKIQTDPAFTKNVLWTDEATFTHDGIFNLKNNHTAPNIFEEWFEFTLIPNLKPNNSSIVFNFDQLKHSNLCRN
jgi:hypothetical protein